MLKLIREVLREFEKCYSQYLEDISYACCEVNEDATDVTDQVTCKRICLFEIKVKTKCLLKTLKKTLQKKTKRKERKKDLSLAL